MLTRHIQLTLSHKQLKDNGDGSIVPGTSGINIMDWSPRISLPAWQNAQLMMVRSALGLMQVRPALGHRA